MVILGFTFGQMNDDGLSGGLGLSLYKEPKKKCGGTTVIFSNVDFFFFFVIKLFGILLVKII